MLFMKTGFWAFCPLRVKHGFGDKTRLFSRLRRSGLE